MRPGAESRVACTGVVVPRGRSERARRRQRQYSEMYSDADAAALYNALNPWGPSDDFYVALAMASPSVLDVGCGTGRMLHRARAAGHAGRLVGIDPDRGMLDIARRHSDIEWVEGTAASMTWDREFDLAVMMSHAFQCFVTDDELRTSLAAIRCALLDDGRFVFETRNPAVREWEEWNPRNPIDVADPAGRPVRVTYEVQAVEGDVVTFTETTSDPEGTVLRVDRGRLRFLDRDALTRFLFEVGFTVDAQYGGWFGETLDQTSREIVTFARRA
jgi:SAM-dependent methyltransferase